MLNFISKVFLILLGLKTIFIPIRILLIHLEKYITLLTFNTWRDFLSYNLFVKFIFFSQVISNVLFFFLYLLASILFLRRSKTFPKLMIIILSFDFILETITFTLSLLSTSGNLLNNIPLLSRFLTNIFIVIGVQVAYLLRSKLVKNTFVN